MSYKTIFTSDLKPAINYFSLDAYVYELDFVVLEGLDYNDDLTDDGKKYFTGSLVGIEKAVSF